VLINYIFKVQRSFTFIMQLIVFYYYFNTKDQNHVKNQTFFLFFLTEVE